MCMPKAPKPAPAPIMPSVYNPQATEVVDQSALDENNRERRRRAALYGRSSTIIAGNTPGGAGQAPTAGTKTLLGS